MQQNTTKSQFVADKIGETGLVTQTVLNYLRTSDLVIADIGGENPELFYEMGYRASLNKPTIYLKYVKEVAPFEIQGTRAFDYDLSDLDAVDNVKDRLASAIRTMQFGDIADSTDEGTPISNADVMSMLFGIYDQIADLKKSMNML